MSSTTSPYAFKAAMEGIKKDLEGDPEAAHSHADDLLCRTLEELGYGEGVEVFRSLTKWYV